MKKSGPPPPLKPPIPNLLSTALLSHEIGDFYLEKDHGLSTNFRLPLDIALVLFLDALLE